MLRHRQCRICGSLIIWNQSRSFYPLLYNVVYDETLIGTKDIVKQQKHLRCTKDIVTVLMI